MGISRGVLKADTENVIREIDLLKKQVELDSKTVTDIMRQRETLNHGVIRTDERTKKQSEIVKLHEARTQALEKDVKSVKTDLQEAVKKVYELDKAREKYGFVGGVEESRQQVLRIEKELR